MAKIILIGFISFAAVMSIVVFCLAYQDWMKLKKNRDIYDEVKELDNE